jgi:phosphoribosylaminoimidazolecarboxamide formyltransferase/IMP cyclohydrolase
MRKINRALISVSDKGNLEKIVNYLVDNNIEIISTGGTYKKIKEISDKVIEISEYTQYPEIMEGRVKTLNPIIHGGVLAKRSSKQHLSEMQHNNIKPIDLVIVNLYPFAETIAASDDFNKAIENIDVGGPTMIRAAAKNHNDVTVITDINDYDLLLSELRINDNHTSLDFRMNMAAKAFNKTAEYDIMIANWFNDKTNNSSDLHIRAQHKQDLRYGENPHQKAKLYKVSNEAIVGAVQIQGKELSFNNINDADSAFALVREFKDPAAAIIKHANPCGVAESTELVDAFIKAKNCDPISSFGGIVALNRILDLATAEKIKESFFEVIIAPEITDEAKDLLASKKNMRILLCDFTITNNNLDIRAVLGGVLVQDRDLLSVSAKDLEIVTKKQPNEQEIANMIFAFKAVKHVRSNAVLFAKNQMSIAIGAGQMSRVDSVRIATLKLNDFYQANQNFHKDNLVLASDAFFPFADGVELAAKAGVTAIIQPGGSVRDAEVIEKAEQLNIAMAFTKIRHFKH